MSRANKMMRRLIECTRWCEQAQQENDPDPASIFRSPALMPSPTDWKRDRLLDHWRGSPGQPGLVNRLIQKREALLNLADGTSVQENSLMTVDSRILVYYPYATVNDGAAELASQGYFGIDDVPPWDTWFWFDYDPSKLRGLSDYSDAFYLLALVPQAYIEYADKGIGSIVAESLVYAEDSGLDIVPELRHLGVIG